MAGPRVDAVERTVSCGQARAVPNPLADPTRKCNISYILTLWNPKESGLETLISIVGGVALLLWGVRMVRTGVTRSFGAERSEEHTSELQSLMRIAYAVFCLKKTKQNM